MVGEFGSVLHLLSFHNGWPGRRPCSGCVIFAGEVSLEFFVVEADALDFKSFARFEHGEQPAILAKRHHTIVPKGCTGGTRNGELLFRAVEDEQLVRVRMTTQRFVPGSPATAASSSRIGSGSLSASGQ